LKRDWDLEELMPDNRLFGLGIGFFWDLSFVMKIFFQNKALNKIAGL